MQELHVASFYRFTNVSGPDRLRDRLQSACEERGLLGTVLISDEGINGTLTGSEEAIRVVLDLISEQLLSDKPDAPLSARWTRASEPPFRRLRIRLKTEIVTLGRPDIRPQEGNGTHVAPDEWNRLIDNPETLVIDTRNRYEIEVGTFPGAVDPKTQSFREFPEFAAGLDEADKARPVAMFCTGGIRCEKASALMLEMGFSNVSQLDGGILNYLETVSDEDNRWQGECFVFDTRVAVDRELAEGGYVQCHACRRPLSESELRSADYREGVSCPKCIGEIQPERATRLEERRKQVQLARQRGEAHIGAQQRDEPKSD